MFHIPQKVVHRHDIPSSGPLSVLVLRVHYKNIKILFIYGFVFILRRKCYFKGKSVQKEGISVQSFLALCPPTTFSWPMFLGWSTLFGKCQIIVSSWWGFVFSVLPLVLAGTVFGCSRKRWWFSRFLQWHLTLFLCRGWSRRRS